MATSPRYDANKVEGDFGSIVGTHAACRPVLPLFNRATAGLYLPGSTFKLVTAAAALDTGAVTPRTVFDDRGYCTEYGKPVYNFADQSGPEQFGSVTRSQKRSSTRSTPSSATSASSSARSRSSSTASASACTPSPASRRRLEQRPSGLYRTGSLFFPKHDYQVDPGRLAFGQERLGVTPLADGDGGGGDRQRRRAHAAIPRREDPAAEREGAQRTKPNEVGRVMKPTTAAELTAMMVSVVNGGTGTAAQIPGVQVAGKTGTAETGVAHLNTTWFVRFAPALRSQVAVAVVLEQPDGDRRHDRRADRQGDHDGRRWGARPLPNL